MNSLGATFLLHSILLNSSNPVKAGRKDDIDPEIQIKYKTNIDKIRKEEIMKNLKRLDKLNNYFIYGNCRIGKSMIK